MQSQGKSFENDGETNEIKYEVVSVDKMENHSHIPSRGKLLAEEMVNEMEVEYVKEMTNKPRVVASEIRKSVQRKYKIQYEGNKEAEEA